MLRIFKKYDVHACFYYRNKKTEFEKNVFRRLISNVSYELEFFRIFSGSMQGSGSDTFWDFNNCFR
jgi:hypothetical protein